MQPSVSVAGSNNRVQKVAKVAVVSNTNLSGTAHDIEQVHAPAVTTEIAAAGAAVPAASGFLRSPWTIGFLGVLALAGTAFIFL
jgi:hypothetical protein